MPNYILSRTSPPAHIYERKINLGYGIKVDTSDAPTNQAQKGKEMNDAKEVLDVADKPITVRGTYFDKDLQQFVHTGAPNLDAAFNEDRSRADLEAQEAEDEAKERSV